ncbi:MAG: FkbM family methyltransferase, partial [Clostridiales bacterium]|nr:FkbM family methyltransferase [Clostridiales bacterium]
EDYLAYAYEINRESYDSIASIFIGDPRVIVSHNGCGDKEGCCSAVTYNAANSSLKNDSSGNDIVEVHTIDVEFAGKDITYLKINTVGTEMDVLKGAASTIKRCLPKLAAAIFMQEDLWHKVPEFIWSIDGRYDIYFRQYAPQATICLAVPPSVTHYKKRGSPEGMT